MKIKIFVIVVFLLLFGLFTGFVFVPQKTNPDNIKSSINNSVLGANAPTSVKAISKPIRLKIPTLNIDTVIESVATDSAGRMGIPSNDDNVAWWMLGAMPGDIGNAVIAGHYDKKDGGAAVFYNLDDLKIGDVIETIDADSKKYTFKVVKKEIYKDESFPLDLVFGKSTNENLNLITCEGTFDKNTKNYSDRLVIFTTLQK